MSSIDDRSVFSTSVIVSQRWHSQECANLYPMLRPHLIFALLPALFLACGGGGGDSNDPTPEPSPTQAASGPAEQALARYVETTLQRQFVEDCTKADVAKDTNKICATFRGERANQRAYVVGPTFSEPTQWVILEDKGGGQWAAAGTTLLNADAAAVPGIPWPLRTGTDLIVVGVKPDCLNVREGPALNQKAVDCIAEGAKIRLSAGPLLADNINWWQVEGRSGWVSGDYLRYPDAAQ